MSRQNYFLIFFMLFTISRINCQVIVVDNFHVLVQDIDEKTVDEILLSVRNGIKKYEKLANLLDDGEQDVTINTVEKFNALFKRNAMIYSDITKKAALVTCENYSRMIYTHLDQRGVNYNMFSAVIDGIDYDENLGIYTIDVLSRKYLFNGLDEDYEPFYCKKGRTFNLRFTFEIDENEIDIAEISKIQGNLISECENKTSRLNPYARIGIGSVSMKSSDFFINELPDFNVDFKVTRTYSVGAKFEQLLNKKRNILLTIGAGYSRINLNSNWNGFFEYNKFDDENILFKNITQLTNGSEKIQLHYVEFPLGLKMRIANWSSFHLFVEPFFETKLIIDRFNNTASFNGESISSGIYPNGDIELFNLEGTNLIPTKIDLDSEVSSNNLLFSVGSLVSLQYVINNKLGIEFGADYTFGLNNLFTPNSDATYYPDNDAFNSISLTQGYLDNIQFSSFGLQIGLLFTP